LAEAGWAVRVAVLGTREQLKGAAARHAAQRRGSTERLTPAALDGAELVVDALFGAGLSRALEGAAAAARKSTIVAVDIPSGVMGDTGENLGAAPAALTIACFRKKPQVDRELLHEILDVRIHRGGTLHQIANLDGQRDGYCDINGRKSHKVVVRLTCWLISTEGYQFQPRSMNRGNGGSGRSVPPIYTVRWDPNSFDALVLRLHTTKIEEYDGHRLRDHLGLPIPEIAAAVSASASAA
jgi:hypothetical protein